MSIARAGTLRGVVVDVLLSFDSTLATQAHDVAQLLRAEGMSAILASEHDMPPSQNEQELHGAKCLLTLFPARPREVGDALWARMMKGIRKRIHVLLLIGPGDPRPAWAEAIGNVVRWFNGNPDATDIQHLVRVIRATTAEEGRKERNRFDMLQRRFVITWHMNDELTNNRRMASKAEPSELGSAQTTRVLVDSEHHPRAPAVSPSADNHVRRGIFLCYRHDDTQDATARLYDRLGNTFGKHRVFMDIDSVPLGVNFVTYISEHMDQCVAVLVMIGRNWTSIRDEQGQRRLDDPSDHVRIEIAAALKQQIPLIPVLVQNAPMPGPSDLPEDIRQLAFYNGIKLAPEFWQQGVERLLRELDRSMRPYKGS